MLVKIGASLACADQLNLSEELATIRKEGIDFIHIDIMDGVYVNNYCYGTDILDYLKSNTNIEIDVHLMVDDPYNKIDFFKDKYFNKLSFHVESCKNPIQMISKIKNLGKECGVALNAATHENSIYYLYDYLDYVLVMTVEAGFKGQEFIEASIEKTKNIRKELKKRKMDKDIYVDGHIDSETILKLREAGANVFIGGTSGLFRQGYSFKECLILLRKSLKRY